MSQPYQSAEQLCADLRALYAASGYRQYKMSKFEEYDYYVRNKDFLISDSVITFTDTNGKLMALKPDVTLSIVKNSKDMRGGVQKMYYNENVYRVSGGAHEFREIVQLGLECIGDIDDYCVLEVLTLAARSLRAISPQSVLCVSQLDILSGSLMGVTGEVHEAILRCIGEKNAHELRRVCDQAGIADRADRLCELMNCYGAPGDVLPKLEAMFGRTHTVVRLSRIMDAMEKAGLGGMIRIDFSVVNDVRFYNGIVFKGYVEGVPQSVISGGQYDGLMRKLGRRSGALGFAIYTDMLERLFDGPGQYDADVLLLYSEADDLADVQRAVRTLQEDGSSVVAQRIAPDKLRCRRTAKIVEGEVSFVHG